MVANMIPLDETEDGKRRIVAKEVSMNSSYVEKVGVC